MVCKDTKYFGISSDCVKIFCFSFLKELVHGLLYELVEG